MPCRIPASSMTAFVLAVAGFAPAPVPAAVERCGAVSARADAALPLPGRALETVQSHDGCYAFVALKKSGPGSVNGIAVLRRIGGMQHVVRIAPLGRVPRRMSLTGDGRVLAVAAGDFHAYFEVARLIDGRGDPVLGYGADGSRAQAAEPVVPFGDPSALNVAMPRDGRLMLAGDADRFAPDLASPHTVSVIDGAKAPATVRAAPAGFTGGAGGRELVLCNYGSETVAIFDVAR